MSFAGYNWTARWYDGTPGPNKYSTSSNDVWVDSQGLHLSIHKTNGMWYSTEVFTPTMGMGTYAWTAEGPFDSLDKNAVFGLFTYESDVEDHNREFDFEVARWGQADDPTNAQFVIQPTSKGNWRRYTIPSSTTVATFVWRWWAGKIVFWMYSGAQIGLLQAGDNPTARFPATDFVSTWTYENSSLFVSGKEDVFMDLWLTYPAGGTPAPSNGLPVEMLVKDFKFIKLAAEPPTTSSSSPGPGDGTVLPTDPNILYLGRWDKSDPARPLATWSYAGLRVAFTGPSVTVSLPNRVGVEWYLATVDGVERFNGALSSGAITISGLSATGTHRLEVHKRTEADTGGCTFTGLKLAPGKSTENWAAPARRLEFIGDSITCGYGVLGANKDCPWSIETVDATKTYAAITARNFSALLNVECWSGIGLIRNWGEGSTSTTNMPYYYDYTAPATSTVKYNWAYQPQGIVVNLGTNDYSAPSTSVPSNSAFVSAMVSFFSTLHARSPSAHIFAACMDDWSDTGVIPKCENVKQAVTQYSATWAAVHFVKLPDLSEATEFGCNWHPNIAGHKKYSDMVIPAIASALGWTSDAHPLPPPDSSSTSTRECDVPSSCCDGYNFLPSSTVCRASVRACDPQESCTGSSASCPADINNCASSVLALWHFDEGTGQTTSDSSGNGLSGTLSGMSRPWVTGVSGKALRFLKTGGVVSVEDPQKKLAPAGDSSWSVWLKFSSLGPDEPILKNRAFQLYHQGGASGNKLFWLVSITDKSSKSGDSLWAGEAAVLTSTSFRTYRWYHVVGVRSGDNLLIYVNGRLDRSLGCLAGKSLDPSVATPLAFGRFSGTIDEVKVVSAALTQAEVQAEFAKFSGRTEQDEYDEETSSSSRASALLSVLPAVVALLSSN